KVGSESKNVTASLLNASDNAIGASGSESFQDVGHELAGELAREALDSRRIFLDEGGKVGGCLVLLAKDVVRVAIEDRAVFGGERDGGHDGDDEAGRLLRRGIVGERRRGLFENGSAQHGVGIGG